MSKQSPRVYFRLKRQSFPCDLAVEVIGIMLAELSRPTSDGITFRVQAGISKVVEDDGTYYVGFSSAGLGQVFQSMLRQKTSEYSLVSVLPAGVALRLLEPSRDAPARDLRDFAEALRQLRDDLAAQTPPPPPRPPADEQSVLRLTGESVFYGVPDRQLSRHDAIEAAMSIVDEWGDRYPVGFGATQVDAEGMYHVGFSDGAWGRMFAVLLRMYEVRAQPQPTLPGGRVPELPRRMPRTPEQRAAAEQAQPRPQPQQGSEPGATVPRWRQAMSWRPSSDGRLNKWRASLGGLGAKLDRSDPGRLPNQRPKRS